MFATVMCFHRRRIPQTIAPSQAEMEDPVMEDQRDAFVAKWHFHPKLLEKYEGRIPRTVPIVVMKELGIFDSGQGGSSYSSADVIPEKSVIVAVPTYTNQQVAKTDVTDALSFKNIMITVNNALTSNISSKRKRVDDSATLVHSTPKRKKLLKNMSQEELISVINDLEQSMSSLAKENEELQEGIRMQMKAEEPIESKDDQVEIDIALLKKAGMTRYTMSRSDFFEENQSLCKEFYGFCNFDYLKRFISKMFDVEYIPPTYCIKGATSYQDKALSKFEQILLTLFFTNTQYNSTTIGIVFGHICRHTVGKYINKWMPLLGEIGDMLSNLNNFLDPEALDQLEPEWYIKLGLRKIAAVVDGKDFLCETVRTDRTLNSAQSSNKVNHSAFRLLTWSLPCGAVVARTPACFGRASEKAILRAWGSLGMLAFAKGYCILGDKGFDNTACSYTNYNTTLHPAFLRSPQFSRDQVNHNIRICQKRYSCETVYSRIAQLNKLNGVCAREHFHHFEDIVGWSHGLANISYGYLQKVEGYDH
jgi:hypothetical protein